MGQNVDNPVYHMAYGSSYHIINYRITILKLGLGVIWQRVEETMFFVRILGLPIRSTIDKNIIQNILRKLTLISVRIESRVLETIDASRELRTNDRSQSRHNLTCF